MTGNPPCVCKRDNLRIELERLARFPYLLSPCTGDWKLSYENRVHDSPDASFGTVMVGDATGSTEFWKRETKANLHPETAKWPEILVSGLTFARPSRLPA